MSPESSASARVERTRRAILVASVAVAVAVLGTLATGRLSFAVGVAASAALGFGTMSTAVRRGQVALVAGEPAKAGATAGALLAARFLGVAGLMVAAVLAPNLIDMWGVVAGAIVADVTLIVSEGLKALIVA
jgi:hypothetical protein